MADNVAITAGTGTTIATDDISNSNLHFQRVKLVDGTLDSTAVIAGDATYGLDVDVTRLPALPVGDNNIGNVDLASAIPAGSNNIGDVDIASIAAGDNNIGNVDVVTLPNTTSDINAATLITKTIDFTASQTAQTIWSPTTSKYFVITDMIVSASAAGVITIFDHTDSTTYRIAKLNLAANGGAVINYTKPRKGQVGTGSSGILKYTTGTGIAGSITVTGYEV